MNEFVTAIGLVFVIEGLLYALIPGRLKSMMSMVERLSEDVIRNVGIAAVALGVLIVWAAR